MRHAAPTGDTPDHFTGTLTFTIEPQRVQPGSPLNDPRYARWLEWYEYAAANFGPATAALSVITVEQAYLVWLSIEVGRSVMDARVDAAAGDTP
ncbi:hypothetical protein JNUCC0626_20120 [Lentzea sp. JNUCC 0626]|uniref:hypothetical protein n=1 Tax=Lentzea sp. JNUCC 0626 TaxID=3367513 RepID=UPI003747BEAB